MHAHMALVRSRYHVQPGQIREDPVSHERTYAHGAVVRASHGMADPRVDPPYAHSVGEPKAALELCGLAEQRDEAPSLAADRRHLIHHAARRADDQVLDLLAPH